MVNLKSFLSGNQKEKEEYFWSLVIEPGWTQAGIWTIKEGKVKVVSTSPPTVWKTDEELISNADTALSVAVQNLSEDAPEPSRTVFGISSTWASEGQIKKEYLEKLKKLCSELSLEPTGFVALPEAIAHLVKTEEGAPLNAITIGISKEDLEVSVFKLGNLVGTSNVARSVSVFDDVVEGLTRFTGDEALPSRFIIYDGKEGELEDARQSLLSGDWDELEKINFLHTPKVEVLIPERKIIAVSLGGASEIADVTAVAEVKDGEKEEKVSVKKEVGNIATPKEKVSPEDVGFVIGEDVEATTPQPEKKTEKETESPKEKEEEGVKKKDPTIHPPQHMQKKKFTAFDANKVSDSLRKVKLFLTSFGGRIFRKPFDMGGKKTFIFGGIFFLVIIVAGFIFWWFYPKATVTVYVSPRKLDEKTTVFVDPKASSVDFSEKVLPGQVVTTTTSGDKTTSTTGTRTVGERANGEVTIYRVGPETTLPAGTTLYGPNNLDFTLDESVTVASGSSLLSPGTTTALITAEDIGSQYNLESGTTFSVGNYGNSELVAKNDSAFSGGSSREILAVSEEDQEILIEELTEELTEKARSLLRSKTSEDQFFIEESTLTTPSSKEFSAKVGDEADTLKLSLSLDVEGLVVDKIMLFNLAKDVLKGKVPDGYVLKESQIDFEFDFEGEDGGVYEIETLVDANLLPVVNTDEIAKAIAGRYSQLAQDYLRSIPGFTRAQIKIKPKFPGKLGTLPRVVKNIFVEVAAER